jgi:acid phosphatase (class A)
MIALNRRMLMGAAAIALAAFAQPALADDPHPYFKGDVVPLLELVVPPTAPDSVATKAELDDVVKIMAAASDDRKKLAIADDEENLVQFLAGTSVKVDAAKIPLTIALIQRVIDTEDEVTTPAKKGFDRKRPPLVDERIKPLIKLSKSGAYPSGHTTNGTATAIVVAKMLPEKRAELMQRAKDYAWSRMIVGVHYPTDLEAGYASGALLAQAVMQNADFQKEFEPAKAELRKALGL